MRNFISRLANVLTSRWMYLALMIPVVLLAVAAAVLIWPINYAEGPYRRDPYRKYATPSSLTPVLNDASAAGDSVFLNDVRLTPVAKKDAYIAEGAGGKKILVIATGQAAPLPRKPAVADVQGVVRTLPPATALKHEWKLDRSQLKAISGNRYYVAAQRIHVDARQRAKD